LFVQELTFRFNANFSFYVDYRNVKPDYVKAYWNVVNWDVVEQRLSAAK